tara:strand:+ start:118 stop:294 length:177 start_codon:yes stop_codon:yes gene_type:complete
MNKQHLNFLMGLLDDGMCLALSHKQYNGLKSNYDLSEISIEQNGEYFTARKLNQGEIK